MKRSPMNQKIDITRYAAEQLNLPVDEKSLRKYKRIWWQNLRLKKKGGLRLTQAGYDSLNRAGIRNHRIKYEGKIHYTNQLVLWLDNYMDCPWYITPKEVYVFNDKMAVQLVLFSGDIVRLTMARVESDLTKTTT